MVSTYFITLHWELVIPLCDANKMFCYNRLISLRSVTVLYKRIIYYITRVYSALTNNKDWLNHASDCIALPYIMVIKNALGNSMLFGWRIPILHRPADVIMMVAYAPAPNRHQAIPNHHADFQWLHNIILANIWYYVIYNNGITAIKQTILGRCGEIGNPSHYNDVIMSTMASQITSLTIVYSSVYSGADQRKHQSLASLAFVRGIRRSPMNSPHKGPVTRKMFPFDDVIIFFRYWQIHLSWW